MHLSFDYNIPEILIGKLKISRPYENINASGYTSSYGIDLKFPEMNLSKTIKSRDFYLLKGKIEETLRNWEAKYKPYVAVKSVDEMNKEAKGELIKLQNILVHTLEVNDEINWDKIRRDDAFHVESEKLFDDGVKSGYVEFDEFGYPTELIKKDCPAKPEFEKFKNGFDFFTKLLRRKAIEIKYENRLRAWKHEVELIKKENANQEVQFNFDF